MIAEPYICVKGPRAGEIQWYNHIDPRYVDPAGEYHTEGVPWRVYADFEREKLGTLWTQSFGIDRSFGYVIRCQKRNEKPVVPSAIGIAEYASINEIGYSTLDYHADSESSRLLKRAEFLKAVFEKEGWEWLPQQGVNPTCAFTGHKHSHSDCDKPQPIQRDIVKELCDLVDNDVGVKAAVRGMRQGFGGKHVKGLCWCMEYHCAADEGIYVGDMQPGETRDIIVDGQKLGTVSRNAKA